MGVPTSGLVGVPGRAVRLGTSAQGPSSAKAILLSTAQRNQAVSDSPGKLVATRMNVASATAPTTVPTKCTNSVTIASVQVATRRVTSSLRANDYAELARPRVFPMSHQLRAPRSGPTHHGQHDRWLSSHCRRISRARLDATILCRL